MGGRVGEQGGTPLARFQYRATRSPDGAAAVSANPRLRAVAARAARRRLPVQLRLRPWEVPEHRG